MNATRILLCTALIGLTSPMTPLSMGETFTGSSTVGQMIRDQDPNGLGNSIMVSTPITSITDVRVTLDITGGWNGDYYAYLRHGATDFSILLNRVGTPGNGGFGYADAGFGPDAKGQPFTLSDSGAFGVHDYQAYSPIYNGSGQLTGTWQPDGSSFAAVFGGSDPNGMWTLFIADNSTVGVGTLQAWDLTIEGTVPDDGATFYLLSISLIAACLIRGCSAGRWRAQSLCPPRQ
jgi:subtilisin-like proprotein convertase family protein